MDYLSIPTSEYVSLYVWLTESLTALGPRPDPLITTIHPNPRSGTGGLLDFISHPPATGIDDSNVRRWCEKLESIRNEFCRRPAAVAICAEPLVNTTMRATLDRLKKRGPAEYSDCRAALYLICAIAAGLSTYRHHAERGSTPKQPTAEQWRSSIRAIKTLMSAERDGIYLAQVYNEPGAWLPFNLLPRLLVGLQAAAKSARKPHRDGYAATRSVQGVCPLSELVFCW